MSGAFDKAWSFLKAEDTFRMKRPDMHAEARGIMDELARREWNKGDKGKDEFGDFGPEVASQFGDGEELMSPALVDFEGRIEHGEDEETENITPEMFRMKRPEMEERLLALQTELARRGRPLIGDKFTDTHSDEEGIADDGSTMWIEEPGLADGWLAENKNLVDEMGDKARGLNNGR